MQTCDSVLVRGGGGLGRGELPLGPRGHVRVRGELRRGALARLGDRRSTVDRVRRRVASRRVASRRANGFAVPRSRRRTRRWLIVTRCCCERGEYDPSSFAVAAIEGDERREILRERDLGPPAARRHAIDRCCRESALSRLSSLVSRLSSLASRLSSLVSRLAPPSSRLKLVRAPRPRSRRRARRRRAGRRTWPRGSSA